MLYIIAAANHPEVPFKGGQRGVIHIEADLKKAVLWASTNKILWAFTKQNAGARYAEFFNSVDKLTEVN